MVKQCIIMVYPATKKLLSDFKQKHEPKIIAEFKKERRFVSWDDVIRFAIKKHLR